MANEGLDLGNYSVMRERFDKLIKEWEPENRNTKERRKLRKLDLDVESLQNTGVLASDETLIPIRTIDSRIKKEQPAYVSYLTKSRRLAIFTDIDNPNTPTASLEMAYTRGMTYNGWEIPFYSCLDGAQLHAWDAIEIEYSPSKPLKVGYSHVGHENLIFPLKCKILEECEIILRKFEISLLKLREFSTAYGFNAPEIERLLQEYTGSKSDEFLDVYKAFIKKDGLVYTAWFSQKCASEWLRIPQPLWLGRKKQTMQTVLQPDAMTGLPMPVQVPTWEDVYESQFPIKVQLYDLTEEQPIVNHVGRGFLDEPEQEAQTSVWTCMINGTVRASNVYASPKNPSATGGSIKQLDCQLQHGCIYDTPLDFWHTDYPDPMLLDIVNKLDLQKQAESGQIAYAVNNRQDSRKTATEVDKAEKQQAMLSGVQVTLYSTFLREVHAYTWPIVQSLALQGEITLFVDPTLLQKRFEVRPAGDEDVIRRAERYQAFKELWPIISQTPAAAAFLGDIIQQALPEDANKYVPMIMQDMQQKNQAAILADILAAMLQDPQVAPALGQYAPQIQTVLQQVNANQPTQNSPTGQ